jgi:hypothetical protein
MWRRLNREDFAGANPLLDEERERTFEFTWAVHDGYRIVGEGGEDAYYVATGGAVIGSEYDPLVDTPYLFLEFARLHERRNRSEAIGAWISRYGLLGLHRDEGYERRHNPVPALPPLDYRSTGGPGERVAVIDEEVIRANYILTLYEAALSKDVETLEQTWNIQGTSENALEGRRYFRQMAETIGSTYLDALVHVAVRQVLWEAWKIIPEYCYPGLTHRSPTGPVNLEERLAPELLMASVRPRNLLGAMYAQFYWLLASGGDLSRCKHCGRIISHAPSAFVGGRRGRKPRKDKEFCDSRCRQNYHYHHRIKDSGGR